MKKKKFIVYLKLINLIITDFALIVFIIMTAYLLLRSFFSSLFKDTALVIALSFTVMFAIFFIYSKYTVFCKKANTEAKQLYLRSYNELQKGMALQDTQTSEIYLITIVEQDHQEIVLIDCDGNTKTILEHEYRNHFTVINQ